MIKVIAAFSVVAIHTNLPILFTLGGLAVPIFIIISSFFFFKRYDQLKTGKLRFLGHFEKRIGLLFLSWQLIYIIYPYRSLRLYWHVYHWNLIGYIKYLYHFFLPSSPGAVTGWGPSWYLIAVMMGLPIFLFILYLSKNNIVPITIICIGIETYLIMATGYTVFTHFQFAAWLCYSFPRSLIYILIGMLIARAESQINALKYFQIVALCSIFFILFVCENIFIFTHGGGLASAEIIMTVPTSIACVLLALRWPFKLPHTVIWRNYSTFLYCIHTRILEFMALPIPVVGALSKRIEAFCFIILVSLAIFAIFEFVRKKTNWYYLNCLV